jgi:para-nitrobenzyl esterase
MGGTVRYLIPGLMLISVACAQRATSNHPDEEALLGTSWRLVEFEGGDGTVLRPTRDDQYTLTFDERDRAAVRVDCNRGASSWTSPERSVLRFGPLGLTKMYCGPNPLNDRIARDWEYVRTYTLRDGHLYLALMADGGIYEFAPLK